MITINLLRNYESNQTVKNFLDIYDGKNADVQPNYYEGTVFESQEKYRLQMSMISGYAYGSMNMKLVNNILLFLRGNETKVTGSRKDKGDSFGVVMLDYISSFPMLCVTVTNSGNNNYTYKSVTYDKATDTFIESQTSSSSVSEVQSLRDFFMLKLNIDVDKFAEAK